MSHSVNFLNLAKEDWSTERYDLSIFALGFESRATNLLSAVKDNTAKGIAIGFNYGQSISYALNRNYFLNATFDLEDNISDSEFEATISKTICKLITSSNQKIFVDVSCFTRFRLAAIVNQIFLHSKTMHRDLVVDFAYSLAEFKRPVLSNHPNTVVGPAHSAFAGWSQDGYSSTAAVLGLGYEQDQALGVVEFLQAGEVWAFSPCSPVEQYKAAVRNANKLLLSELNTSRVLDYDVCSPKSTISRLDSLVRGLGESHSVVLVPFGPKIFVLCSLLIGAIRKDVAVWRVSQGIGINPCDRIASGIEIGLRVIFKPSPI